MAEIINDDYAEYSFPDLELDDLNNDINSVIIKNVTHLVEENREFANQGLPNNNTNQNPSVSDEVISAKYAEVEKLKNEYEGKIQLLNAVLSRLENPLASLDTEVVEMLRLIIKKTVKKLIFKELKTDKNLMNKIIKELEELIQAQSGVITILLSETDFNRLNLKEKSSSKVFKINSNLNEGDVIINSNCGEIRAILNERINQLIGITNA